MVIKLDPLRSDVTIFNKLNLERRPVGVKLLYLKPEGFERLEKKLKLCEMIVEAQRRGQPFYIDKENEDCHGKRVLGMEDFPPTFKSGQIGYGFKIFQEPRANARIYFYVPILKPNTVKYVLFSPMDKLSFDPDLLIVTANVSQAELILRAMSYSTGKPWVSKHSFVLGCAWLFNYPYISGKVNYVVSGMTFGSKVLKEIPEGQIIISIPHDWIPTIVRNLQEMPWVPLPYEGKEKADEIEEIIRRFSSNETCR